MRLECVTAARYVTGDGLTLVQEGRCSIVPDRSPAPEIASSVNERPPGTDNYTMGFFRRRRRRTRREVPEAATEIGGYAAMELLEPDLTQVAVGGIRGVISGIANLLS